MPKYLKSLTRESKGEVWVRKIEEDGSYDSNARPSPRCYLCDERFNPVIGEEAVFLECVSDHHLHLVCAQEWFKQNTDCPICNVDFKNRIFD